MCLFWLSHSIFRLLNTLFSFFLCWVFFCCFFNLILEHTVMLEKRVMFIFKRQAFMPLLVLYGAIFSCFGHWYFSFSTVNGFRLVHREWNTHALYSIIWKEILIVFLWSNRLMFLFFLQDDFILNTYNVGIFFFV